MATLREWVEGITAEPIETVVFGPFGWGGYGDERDAPEPEQGRLYTADEAAAWLDCEFYTGHGAPMTYAVAIYTASWVVSVSQYDGSTSPFALPRNPMPGFVPDMPGG